MRGRVWYDKCMYCTIEKVNCVLNKMRDTFRMACGPRRRGDWLRKNGINNPDWIYSLSADDVINQRIPSHVAGPFARAKLFCKYAKEEKLDCVVLIAPNCDDIIALGEKSSGTVFGYALIAVKIDGVLRAFDPAHRPLDFIPGNICVGSRVQCVRTWYSCPITAIVPRDDFANVQCYDDFLKLYTSKR